MKTMTKIYWINSFAFYDEFGHKKVEMPTEIGDRIIIEHYNPYSIKHAEKRFYQEELIKTHIAKIAMGDKSYEGINAYSVNTPEYNGDIQSLTVSFYKI